MQNDPSAAGKQDATVDEIRKLRAYSVTVKVSKVDGTRKATTFQKNCAQEQTNERTTIPPRIIAQIQWHMLSMHKGRAQST